MLTFQPIRILGQNDDDYIVCGHLAHQFNKLHVEKLCKIHPAYETVIGLQLENNTPTFILLDCCCDKFRNELSAFFVLE